MTPKLTSEQRDALKNVAGPVAVEDEQTNEIYFLIDKPTLEGFRQDADRESIRRGIADMEAGRVISLEELDRQIRRTIHGESST